jgi:hypothetical protein
MHSSESSLPAAHDPVRPIINVRFISGEYKLAFF